MEQVKKMIFVRLWRKSVSLQVVYGAHMTDNYDSRVIVTYLQEFCGAFIFNSKFYFYQDDNTSYGLPSIQNLFGILGWNFCIIFTPHLLFMKLQPTYKICLSTTVLVC